MSEKAGKKFLAPEPLTTALYSVKTRGTFRQVPTRRIRLSFVECAYPDLRDLLHRGLQWTFPLWKRMALNFREKKLLYILGFHFY